MRKPLFNRVLIILIPLAGLLSCNGGERRAGDGINPSLSGYPATPFTIHDASKLIGGPLALGQIGDVLLENDQIRVVIQKPGKNAALGSFGGSIIDADLKRFGEEGQDQFGEIFPLVNIEWTVNYYNYEVIADGSVDGTKTLRAYGRIDVYDYLDIDFIADAAKGIVGQALSFSNRFDDRRDPFDTYDDLRAIDPEVITDYILSPGKRAVRIETTVRNRGEKEVLLPMGEFINGSGSLSLLIPGAGFSPEPVAQVAAYTPGVIYAGFDGVPVSYGYFFDPREFLDPKGNGKAHATTSLTYSGLTGLIYGETFLKLLPLGSTTPPEIHFAIPAGGERKITSYFIVGDGSAGSVFDTAESSLSIPTEVISGTVLDAGGSPVANAIVAIKNKGGATVVTYRTDTAGKFSGMLSLGSDPIALTFGKGVYEASVDVPGYHANGTSAAGICTPDKIDLTTGPGTVMCTLGEAGTVVLASPVVEGEAGTSIAARLTIVGTDPSPNKVGPAGVFHDIDILSIPFGIADVKYIAANGTFGTTGKNSFSLEPGVYRFVFSHGTEYGIDERVIDIQAGGTVTLEPITLPRVLTTPGYVSADFHIHAIHSPDSSLPQENRVLSASAEGLDILQSSDHDYLTDYQPVVERMMGRGLIPADSLKTSIGDEITPNHLGHLHAFPLDHHPDDVSGGAIDWSASDRDELSSAPDYSMGFSEIAMAARADPGEEVIQLNHVSAPDGGIPLANGWVTSPFYIEAFGVLPLSSYGDPVERRLAVQGITATFPIPFGQSDLVIADANAIEVTIGQHLHNADALLRSALPTWFNLLNLGMRLTATADSDSHTEIATPLGMPRNFIASSIDPRDGFGESFGAIDLEEYAHNINEGRVIVSAGPFLSVVARGKDGMAAQVGDTFIGNEVDVEITVTAPSWAWFDTIEIFANTEPIPADDTTGTPMEGTAADPAEFYRPYHAPRYVYQPTAHFRVIEGTLPTWAEKDGVITARVTKHLVLTEDTWVVVMARGTRETKGYRSLFPLVTDVLVDAKETPENFDATNLDAFHADKKVGAAAWGLANPIYIDVDGDGFQAKYIRDGRSPLR